MKNHATAAFAKRVLICCLAVSGLTIQSRAQITLTSGNSSAQVSPNTQAGMFNWTVDGVNQLAQQWFWYRIGAAGPEHSIDTISAPVIVPTGPNMVTTTYANALMSIRVDYTLSGGAIGSGSAQLSELLTINNLSGTALDLHFFQYSDFDLGGTPGGDTVTLKKNLFNKFNEADQTKGNIIFSESTTTGGDVGQPPGADEGEAGAFPNTLNKLTDGLPTTLNNNPGPVGPTDATWAFQWDSLLNPGDSMVISKLKSIEIVPEPGTLALASLGLAALLWQRRKSA